MKAFRIADRRYPIFDGTGAKLAGGRWNSPGRSVIYAAETFAGAMLEVLVHANLSRLPKRHAYVEITIPEDVGIEAVTLRDLPGWDDPDQATSRAFGNQWLAERRSAILLIPSFVTHGLERNILLNPEHADFVCISASPPAEVHWDTRLIEGVSGKLKESLFPRS